ncbi:hypothetical protein D6789_02705 [Candidatus Woesearchaeota archaeon]|nr:MAG: hypothetical protein D6789_02705 [Candidatus Woesearchaeota archaeon]
MSVVQHYAFLVLAKSAKRHAAELAAPSPPVAPFTPVPSERSVVLSRLLDDVEALEHSFESYRRRNELPLETTLRFRRLFEKLKEKIREKELTGPSP